MKKDKQKILFSEEQSAEAEITGQIFNRNGKLELGNMCNWIKKICYISFPKESLEPPNTVLVRQISTVES